MFVFFKKLADHSSFMVVLGRQDPNPTSIAVSREDWQLVADEPVEFEK